MPSHRPRLAERMGGNPPSPAERQQTETDDQLPDSEEIAEDPVGTLDEINAQADQHDSTDVMSAQNEAYAALAQQLDEVTAERDGLRTDLNSLLEGDADADDDADEDDLKPLLVWAMHKLRHPAEQMDFCNTHGKVPMTHMCSVHRNEDYAKALRALGESND